MQKLNPVLKRIDTARKLDKILFQLAYFRDNRDKMVPENRLVIWEENSVQNS